MSRKDRAVHANIRHLRPHPKGKKKSEKELIKQSEDIAAEEKKMQELEASTQQEEPYSTIEGEMAFRLEFFENQRFKAFIRNKSMDSLTAMLVFSKRQLEDVLRREVDKRVAGNPGMTNTLMKKHYMALEVLELHITEMSNFIAKEEKTKFLANKTDILVVPSGSAEKVIAEEKSKVIDFAKHKTNLQDEPISNEPEIHQPAEPVQGEGENSDRPSDPE